MHIDPDRPQHALDLAADLLAVLQGAGRMECDPLLDFAIQLGQQLRLEIRQDFTQVLGQRRNPRGSLRIRRVMREQVAVFLDRRAATGGGHHDRFGTGLQIRPPGIDIAAHIIQAALLVVQVIADRAAAAGLRRDDQLHAERIEHARGGGIGIGRHRRLHAAIQQQHLARMLRSGPSAGILLLRHLVLQRAGQQGPQQLPCLHRRREDPLARQYLPQCSTQQSLRQRPRHLLLDDLAADIDQPPILHAGRTSRFAIAASQAAVQMQLRPGRRFLAFQHLLHQINAAARTVQLIPQQLVGRAGCGAKAAMHAFAQDFLRFLAFAGMFDEVG